MLNQSRKSENLAVLARQLSFLVRSGHAYEEAFRILYAALEGELQSEADELKRYIETDDPASLPDRRYASPLPTLIRLMGIARHKGADPALVLNHAEEVLGPLGESHRVYWSGIGPFLWYALTLIGLMFVALAVFSIFVFPSIREVFQSNEAPLPSLTLFMMSALGSLMDLFFFLIVGAVVALAIVAYKIRDAMKRLEPLRGVITRVPVLNFLCRAYNQVLFLNLSHLLRVAGVPTEDALDEVMRMQQPGKPVFSQLTSTGGVKLDVLMRREPVIAALLLARRAGTLATELEYLSDRSQLTFAQTLARSREEFTLVAQIVVGLVVGALVLSMYLPIFKMGTIF